MQPLSPEPDGSERGLIGVVIAVVIVAGALVILATGINIIVTIVNGVHQ